MLHFCITCVQSVRFNTFAVNTTVAVNSDQRDNYLVNKNENNAGMGNDKKVPSVQTKKQRCSGRRLHQSTHQHVG